jgi:plastocyanin domain-containing protein
MNLRILAFTSLAAMALASTGALALEPGQQAGEGRGRPRASAKAGAPGRAAVVEVRVTKEGFEPAEVTVERGRPVKLVVTRTLDRTCATEIVMKDFGVNRPLPLQVPVEVVVNPPGPGTYRFACGMDMIAGVLRVR